MKQWQHILITAMAFSLLSPTALRAVDQDTDAIEEITPSFQNPAQAERAANLAHSSFTEEDMEQARQQAAIEAEQKIDQLANDYADGVVEQISTDYADKVVDEKAKTHAQEYVEKKAHEYALSVAEGDRAKYQETYDAAMERATDPSFKNARDTAYEAELDRLTNPDDPNFDNTTWQEAYDYAKGRATGDGYHNARQTAYDYAYKRATDPNYPNAYQTEYKKALEAEVADITGQKLQDIHEMRYVEKLGWGVIARKRLQLHPSHDGLGNKWKHKIPPSVDNEIIPPGPQTAELEELPLEQEIAEATQRNVRTGWYENPEFQAKGNKGKGNKKKYGLAQTSGLASEEVRGSSKKGNGNNRDKSSMGNSGKKGPATPGQAASSSSNKSKSNGKKGGNGNKGGNSNKGGNGNKGGNNGNKGGNGKNK